MTSQANEKLIFNGQKLSMACTPKIPHRDKRITKLPFESYKNYAHTGCERRYIATWLIENNKFYLAEIKGKYNLDYSEPIWANWYTGTLRIPQGECLHYIHMGFESIYESELHIEVVKGKITSINEIDTREKALKTKEQLKSPPTLKDRIFVGIFSTFVIASLIAGLITILITGAGLIALLLQTLE